MIERVAPFPVERLYEHLGVRIYMVLQRVSRTAAVVAYSPGELLPHLLTLTSQARRLFSSTILYPRGCLRVKKHATLCCPDFPLLTEIRSDKPTYYFFYFQMLYCNCLQMYQNIYALTKKAFETWFQRLFEKSY